ncbi:hypothetical protein [uncultured Methanobrevibacter sp.]|uniref:hypothetical protein n=1 Tax=uncultured Methanobrevibacter sp. TaxID=253161 RepID=UPI0025CE035F|nr:hypothetical protein [uncultured Methanobrevibacter sp.]
MGLNASFEQIKEDLQSRYENTEKELKETIEKQQTHIDELNEKLESLTALKEYIPPREHYSALQELQ